MSRFPAALQLAPKRSLSNCEEDSLKGRWKCPGCPHAANSYKSNSKLQSSVRWCWETAKNAARTKTSASAQWVVKLGDRNVAEEIVMWQRRLT